VHITRSTLVALPLQPPTRIAHPSTMSRPRRLIPVLVAAFLVSSCATLPFGERLRTKTFDAYIDELAEHSAEIELHGPLPQELSDRFRTEAIAATKPHAFALALARMFNEIHDPHLTFRPSEREEPSPWSEVDLRIVLIEGAWYVQKGPRSLMVLTGRLPELLSVEGLRVWPYVDMAAAALSGPPGTICHLRLKKADGEELRLHARRPEADEMDADMVISLHGPRPRDGLNEKWWHTKRVGDVGYVRSYTFSLKKLGVDLAQARDAIQDELEILVGCGKVVIDLQSNSGGEFSVGLELLRSFIQEEILVRSRKQVGFFGLFTFVLDYVSTPGDSRIDADLVVLVDEFTGSTSEHIASHLARFSDAILVGTRTLGAQYPNRTFEAPDGSSITFGSNSSSFPDTEPFQAVGLEPDIHVPLDLGLARREGYKAAIADVRRRRLEAAFEALGLDPAEAPLWTDNRWGYK
jgi:C-terminal processing protease CtpA/Prc